MTDPSVDGTAIAPGVVETIASLAAQGVEGVQSVGDPTASGIKAILGAKPLTQGIKVNVDEDEKLHVSVHICVKDGQVLPELANQVRQAIADALYSQAGLQVSAVDVFIDSIQFSN